MPNNKEMDKAAAARIQAHAVSIVFGKHARSLTRVTV